MKMSEAFPSKWLTAADLNNKEHVLTIQDVQMQEVGSNPVDNCPCVYFQGAAKALVLNKTNGNTIVGQHGDDTTGWVGKQITIYPTQTEFGGKMVPCIRVKLAAAPAATGPALAHTAIPETGMADNTDIESENPGAGLGNEISF